MVRIELDCPSGESAVVLVWHAVLAVPLSAVLPPYRLDQGRDAVLSGGTIHGQEGFVVTVVPR